ncbi:LacI family DNA-binding transcriptional regulator [Sinomonas sp. JGH33]|uniref:LacI family DNA-binding transcriptional regulator n=1 Tax=Sinomonas terricola TaxID=3110330 RepID=A0ABU5T6G1_9MICC|nr:LacI family DNA-binding transcriptional regulator [Sinomonas sp. JGH33]MEA5455081.1 LacI family DNA-binding transcriptional regulator [Sinomonas sp. JGH33]
MTDRARATIRDVATLSGLSICTVSRALRGLPNVSLDAQKRIEDAAEKLGYRASSAASRLAGGRTGQVAIIAPKATSWFFAEAVEAAEEVFADSGLDTVLVSLRGQGKVRDRLFDDPTEFSQRVDGVLLFGVNLDASQVEALSESRLAVASVGLEGVPWDNVGIDDEAAAWAATRHLLDLGHWDLAMLAGSEPSHGTVTTAAQRRAGFERALDEEHLEPDPDMMVSAPSTIDGGYQAMTELISTRRVPGAVFAGCDEAAFGALKAMREHGLSAPKKVSLIGIDDHPMSSFLGLTTVAQPVPDQGAFAATLLAERLQNHDDGGAPHDHRLPTPLIERKTTRRSRH